MTKENKTEHRSVVGPGYFEIVGLVLLITIATLTCYDRYMASQIYTFDLAGYLQTQKALITAGEISEKELKDNLDKVEELLNDKGGRTNNIILLKDVVLRNGTELNNKNKE